MSVPRLWRNNDFTETETAMQGDFISGHDYGDEARPGRLSLILPAPTDGALPLVSVTIDGTSVLAESRATEPIEHNGHLFVERPVPGGIVCEIDGVPAVFYPIPQPEPTPQDRAIARQLARAAAAEARVAALEADLAHSRSEATFAWKTAEGHSERADRAEARVTALEAVVAASRAYRVAHRQLITDWRMSTPEEVERMAAHARAACAELDKALAALDGQEGG